MYSTVSVHNYIQCIFLVSKELRTFMHLHCHLHAITNDTLQFLAGKCRHTCICTHSCAYSLALTYMHTKLNIHTPTHTHIPLLKRQFASLEWACAICMCYYVCMLCAGRLYMLNNFETYMYYACMYACMRVYNNTHTHTVHAHQNHYCDCHMATMGQTL